MLKSTLLATLALVSSTLALPQALDEARAAVILNLLEKADRDGHDVGLVARQLLGDLFGDNDEFAPYEMPCPSDYTWVRPADVSNFILFHRAIGHVLEYI
jgi:HEAT repeat protein